MRGQRHAPAALYPRETPGTHCTGGWVGPRAGLDRCGKCRPTEIRSPGRPACSQSLYRLSHRAHCKRHIRDKYHVDKVLYCDTVRDLHARNIHKKKFYFVTFSMLIWLWTWPNIAVELKLQDLTNAAVKNFILVLLCCRKRWKRGPAANIRLHSKRICTYIHT